MYPEATSRGWAAYANSNPQSAYSPRLASSLTPTTCTSFSNPKIHGHQAAANPTSFGCDAVACDSIQIMNQIVIDTNVFVSALRSADGASRVVIRRCLQKQNIPCMSLALFSEYRDVLSRDALFVDSPLTASERQELFHSFMAVCQRIEIFYLWRPNLRDEADNHVLELAVAAGVQTIVSYNRADFVGAQLHFPGLRILAPADFLKEA
jgi:putative PIN family toxin of toxin-antitoxin system